MANFTAAMAAPAVGVARGFLAAFEDRLRGKSDTIDDGSMVNFERYATATANVDAVHAMTLQNAHRFARVTRARGESPKIVRDVAATRRLPLRRRAEPSTCCTRSAAAAPCSSARTSAAVA